MQLTACLSCTVDLQYHDIAWPIRCNMTLHVRQGAAECLLFAVAVHGVVTHCLRLALIRAASFSFDAQFSGFRKLWAQSCAAEKRSSGLVARQLW
mmetsp:Transcript_5368/g.8656  ORF Transcript_5368/g.8656 Transcript_5368/m.8656 type:complete len:95 (+) Transcript_5368:397-681(+)